MSDTTTLVLYGLGTAAVLGVGYLIYLKVSAKPQLTTGQQASGAANQQRQADNQRQADVDAAIAADAAIKAAAVAAASEAAAKAAAKAAAEEAAKKQHCVNQLGEPVECPPSANFALTQMQNLVQASTKSNLLDQWGNVSP